MKRLRGVPLFVCTIFMQESRDAVRQAIKQSTRIRRTPIFPWNDPNTDWLEHLSVMPKAPVVSASRQTLEAELLLLLLVPVCPYAVNGPEWAALNHDQ